MGGGVGSQLIGRRCDGQVKHRIMVILSVVVLLPLLHAAAVVHLVHLVHALIPASHRRWQTHSQGAREDRILGTGQQIGLDVLARTPLAAVINPAIVVVRKQTFSRTVKGHVCLVHRRGNV